MKFIKNKQQLINLNFRQTATVIQDQFGPYWIVKDLHSPPHTHMHTRLQTLCLDVFTEASDAAVNARSVGSAD